MVRNRECSVWVRTGFMLYVTMIISITATIPKQLTQCFARSSQASSDKTRLLMKKVVRVSQK